MAFFDSFTSALKQKWLEFYQVNRPWLSLHMQVVSVETPDGGRRPPSYFILGALNGLEPKLAQLMVPFSHLNPDAETLIKVLGLDFDPDLALGIDSKAVGVTPPVSLESAMAAVAAVTVSDELTATDRPITPPPAFVEEVEEEADQNDLDLGEDLAAAAMAGMGVAAATTAITDLEPEADELEDFEADDELGDLDLEADDELTASEPEEFESEADDFEDFDAEDDDLAALATASEEELDESSLEAFGEDDSGELDESGLAAFGETEDEDFEDLEGLEGLESEDAESLEADDLGAFGETEDEDFEDLEGLEGLEAEDDDLGAFGETEDEDLAALAGLGAEDSNDSDDSAFGVFGEVDTGDLDGLADLDADDSDADDEFADLGALEDEDADDFSALEGLDLDDSEDLGDLSDLGGDDLDDLDADAFGLSIDDDDDDDDPEISGLLEELQ